MKRQSSNLSPRNNGTIGSNNTQTRISLHKLHRPEQVVLFRLRTRRNRLHAHMDSKFKTGVSKMCPCNADFITAEHQLMCFERHDDLRWDIWPELIPPKDKLYGNLEKLRRTAAFVQATGAFILRVMKKKKKKTNEKI